MPVHGAQSPGGPSRKQNRAIKPPLPHDPVCPKGRDLIRLIKELRIKRAALSCLSSRTSTLQLRLSVVLERKPVRGIGEISEAVPLAGLRCGTADPHSVNRLKPDPRLAVHPRSSIPEAPARRLVASMTVRGGRPHHTFASSRRRGAGHCCCQRYRGPCLGPGGETRSGASCSTWTVTPCPSSRATHSAHSEQGTPVTAEGRRRDREMFNQLLAPWLSGPRAQSRCNPVSRFPPQWSSRRTEPRLVQPAHRDSRSCDVLGRTSTTHSSTTA